MTKGFSRKLIEVEIRLGFLSIPSRGTELMPEEKTKKMKEAGLRTRIEQAI